MLSGGRVLFHREEYILALLLMGAVTVRRGRGPVGAVVAALGKKEENTGPGLPVRAAVGKRGDRNCGVMVEEG